MAALRPRGYPAFLRAFLLMCAFSAVMATAAFFPRASAENAVKDVIAPQAPKIRGAGYHFSAPSRTAESYIIAAGAPEAAEAGARVLAAGGTALDAAIAAQAALNVVEPQASGIGGGGFLLYYDARAKKLHHYDGRETAPSGISPLVFLNEDGEPYSYFEALEGGRSVGVPGLLHMLETAHKAHGNTPWRNLFRDAVTLAREGVALSGYLHDLAEQAPHFLRSRASDPFKSRSGALLEAGDTVLQPALADTLEAIARGGADILYKGTLGAAVARAVSGDETAPGTLTEADMRGYETVKREPVCAPYRSYNVCGPFPPSSGGVAVLQALALLEAYDLPGEGAFTPDALHLIASALRIAYADRNVYIGDADKVDVPVKGLLDREYLAERGAFILPSEAVPEVPFGVPPGTRYAFAEPAFPSAEPVSTTHISVKDRYGNVASITSSIEYMFGSGISVHGFLLNNQLTDFAFDPEDGKGGKVANAAMPGKRPRSSMAPVIVFDAEDNPVLITGSPGGARIIPYVLQNIVAALDFGMSAEEAALSPRFAAIQPDKAVIELEEGGFSPETAAALEEKGWEVTFRPLTSGIHMLSYRDGAWNGAADPRRDGAVSGE